VLKKKIPTDNIFMIKRAVDKFLGEKVGPVYECFMDFEKAFNSVDRSDAWYEIRKAGASERMLHYIKKMYANTQFREKYELHEMINVVPQTTCQKDRV
jgi:hypothetical protein